jgi:hypothetical protein
MATEEKLFSSKRSFTATFSLVFLRHAFFLAFQTPHAEKERLSILDAMPWS